MTPAARWTQMDSPVKPANDERERGETGAICHSHPTTSPSGLTGGSMTPPARWMKMDSPVKPANDEREWGKAGAIRHPHPATVTLRLDRSVHGAVCALDKNGFAGRAGE